MNLLRGGLPLQALLLALTSSSGVGAASRLAQSPFEPTRTEPSHPEPELDTIEARPAASSQPLPQQSSVDAKTPAANDSRGSSSTEHEDSAPAQSALPLKYAAELGLGALATNGRAAGALFGGLNVVLGRGPVRPGLSLSLVGWRSPLILEPGAEWLMSLCPGFSLQWYYANGNARSAVTLGPALLLDSGSALGATTPVGIFVDLRPVGLSFILNDKLRLGVDLLGLRVLAPDLSTVPLYETQFQTSLWLEFGP